MRILGLIPARSGSKGIPNKNLAKFCGLSLVSRAVAVADEAMHAGMIAAVSISTDCPVVIREHLMRSIVRRPAELATDDSPVIDTVRHALGILGDFDAVLLLQPTNPLRNLDDIRGAIALLEAHPEADSVISHIPARCHPARMRQKLGDYTAKYAMSESVQGTPRQKLPLVLQRTGEIYLTRTSWIAQGRDMEGECCVPWMQDPRRAWDIDGPEDLVIAEALWRAANGSR